MKTTLQCAVQSLMKPDHAAVGRLQSSKSAALSLGLLGRSFKRNALASALCLILLAAVPTPASADANLTAGVLRITHLFNLEEYQLRVGPVPGRVTVLKAPGVVDGRIFNGVHSIVLVTGNGVDKVEIEAELSTSLNIQIETGQGGDEVKVATKALPRASVTAGVEIIGGSGENKLEWTVDSEARQLVLNLVANSLAGPDTLILKVDADTPSDLLAVNISASTETSDDKVEAAIKSAATTVNLAVLADTGNGSDTVKVELEQLTYANVTVDFDFDLSASADNGEIILKGSNANFVVNGLMKGGDLYNDSLTLLIEGSATGAPVLDGGTGQDSCKATIGTLFNCE